MTRIRHLRYTTLALTALVAAIVLAAAQVAGPKRPVGAHSPSGANAVHPADWVVIKQNNPLTVPVGVSLLVTGVGGSRAGSYASVIVDGVTMAFHSNGDGGTSVAEIPVGLVAVAGLTVEATALDGNGRVWGLLIPTGGSLTAVAPTPKAADVVTLIEGQSLVVPAGKYFVVNGLGPLTPGGSSKSAWLSFNGLVELEARPNTLSTTTAPFRVPVGLAAPQGTLVQAGDNDAGGNIGRAWGYFVDS